MTAALAGRQLLLLPITGLALLIYLLLGSRLARADELALYVVAPGRGPIAWAFRRSSFWALTIGAVVLLRDARSLDDEVLLRHEQEHVRQWLRLQIAFAVAYAAASLSARRRGGHWHRDNRFERAARNASRSRR